MTALIHHVPALMLFDEELWVPDPDKEEAARIMDDHFFKQKLSPPKKLVVRDRETGDSRAVLIELSRMEQQLIWISNNWGEIAMHFPTPLKHKDGTLDYERCECLSAEFLETFLAIDPRDRIFRTSGGGKANVYGALADWAVSNARGSAASREEIGNALLNDSDLLKAWTDPCIDAFVLGRQKKYLFTKLPALAQIATRWRRPASERWTHDHVVSIPTAFEWLGDDLDAPGSPARQDLVARTVEKSVAEIVQQMHAWPVKVRSFLTSIMCRTDLLKKAPLTALLHGHFWSNSRINQCFNISAIVRDRGIDRTAASRLVQQTLDCCRSLRLPYEHLGDVMRELMRQIMAGILNQSMGLNQDSVATAASH